MLVEEQDYIDIWKQVELSGKPYGCARLHDLACSLRYVRECSTKFICVLQSSRVSLLFRYRYRVVTIYVNKNRHIMNDIPT